ncbi:major facilitator superfamily domain-containing protein [Jimgerdemannia flammicorona]|uniref:Major facilitator superfamily domain-containing protein n=1 Tax=Jimgerdemannia flammicorona TaxID=994334 RepID=A0A433D751_9FUNG|nr:major facilitator superfamily domain-containing protein [Jimgerdemannia flammicorona]
MDVKNDTTVPVDCVPGEKQNLPATLSDVIITDGSARREDCPFLSYFRLVLPMRSRFAVHQGERTDRRRIWMGGSILGVFDPVCRFRVGNYMASTSSTITKTSSRRRSRSFSFRLSAASPSYSSSSWDPSLTRWSSGSVCVPCSSRALSFRQRDWSWQDPAQRYVWINVGALEIGLIIVLPFLLPDFAGVAPIPHTRRHVRTWFIDYTMQPIPAQWFHKKRATAMGIAASGSGVGGLVLSPLASALIDCVGISWCYRITGLLCFVLSMVAALLAKAKVLPAKATQRTKVVEWSLLKNPSYLLWIAGSGCCILGYLVPFFYLPSYAQSINISTSTSAVLVGVISALNAVGRVLIGLAGDMFGQVNTFIFSALISGLSCLLVWMFAETFAVLLVFGIIYGLFCGVFFTLVAPISAEIVGMEKLASAISLLFCINAVTVFGAPIAGAIQQAVDPNSFLAVVLWSGFTFLAGCGFVTVLRIRITNGRMWIKV